MTNKQKEVYTIHATLEQIQAMAQCFETVVRTEKEGSDLYQAANTGLAVMMGNFIFNIKGE